MPPLTYPSYLESLFVSGHAEGSRDSVFAITKSSRSVFSRSQFAAATCGILSVRNVDGICPTSNERQLQYLVKGLAHLVVILVSGSQPD